MSQKLTKREQKRQGLPAVNKKKVLMMQIPPDLKKSCQLCDFFFLGGFPGERYNGTCHRFPPFGYSRIEFPVVRSFDYCGEFKKGVFRRAP